MKKRFLAVPVVLGVAGASWAGGTLYGGSEARQAYDRLLADVGDASGLTLVPSSYEAGFLHSEAVTELRVGAGDEAATLMRFRHAIEHSPVGDAGLRVARIVTTADTSGLAPEVADAVTALFDGAVPLTVESVIGLGGEAEHAVTVAAWGHEGDAGRVAGRAMEWVVRQSGDGAVSGTGFWPGLTFVSDAGGGARVTLGASHDRFDYARTDDGLYVGEYVAELGDLKASSTATGMGGSLSGMRLSSSTEVAGDVYRGDGAFEIASMELPIELDSMRLDARFDGFPVAGMAGMAKLGRAADAMNAAAFAEDPAATEAALEAYGAALASMLRPGLSIGYGATLTNAGGRAEADYAMSWAGPAAGGGAGALETVGDVVRAVRASMRLDVDADALAMTPADMFLDPAALAPWVTSDADGLRADIVVEDLVMDVNGSPMPLEAIAGPVLDMPLRGLLEGAI